MKVVLAFSPNTCIAKDLNSLKRGTILRVLYLSSSAQLTEKKCLIKSWNAMRSNHHQDNLSIA